MKTLLEKALELKKVNVRKNTYELEDAELAVAWAKGELTTTQCSQAWGFAQGLRGSVYSSLAMSLREALRRGLLKNGQ